MMIRYVFPAQAYPCEGKGDIFFPQQDQYVRKTNQVE